MQRESMVIVTLWRDGLARPCHNEKEIEAAIADGFKAYNPAEHEYPRFMYNGTLSAKVDTAAREQELTREGWTRTPTPDFIPDPGGVEISQSVGLPPLAGNQQGFLPAAAASEDIRSILIEVLLTNSRLVNRVSRLEESLGVVATAVDTRDAAAAQARADLDAQDRVETAKRQLRHQQEEEKPKEQAAEITTKQRLAEEKQHTAQNKVLSNKDGKETKEPAPRDLPKPDIGPKESI